MLAMHYTYIHRRESDNAVFYVGKGQRKRAWECSKRSDYWKRVKNKHGHTVEVCAQWPTEAEAFEHEKFLIECFRHMGAPLVNMTDGGEGVSGLKFTETQVAALKARVKRQWETDREKMMASLTSDEFKAKISVTSTEYANRPEVKARVSAQAKERANDPLVKAKQTALFKDVANRPNVKAQLSARMKAHNARPEIKAAMSGKNSFRARAVVCSNDMRFDTMAQAIEWLHSMGFTKAASASLHHPLRDPSRMAYGFHWRYAETNESLKKEMA
jgi:hypothetical protein